MNLQALTNRTGSAPSRRAPYRSAVREEFADNRAYRPGTICSPLEAYSRGRFRRYTVDFPGGQDSRNEFLRQNSWKSNLPQESSARAHIREPNRMRDQTTSQRCTPRGECGRAIGIAAVASIYGHLPMRSLPDGLKDFLQVSQ